MKCFVAAALVLGGCAGFIKPPDPDRHLHVAVDSAAFDEPHGYHFIALPEPSATVVQLDIRYPVGSADDPPGKAGLAHLVAHLMQQIAVPALDVPGEPLPVAQHLARIARAWTAVTDRDHTTYELTVPPTALDTLLAMEAARTTLGCRGLSEAEFADAQTAVLAELPKAAGVEDLQRALAEALYPVGHPYRQVETAASIKALTFEDACAFLDQQYRHGTVTVAASGAIDRDTLKAAAARGLDGSAPRIITARAIAPVVERDHTTVHVRGIAEAPMVLATWPLPRRGSRDYRLLALAFVDLADRVEETAQTYGWGHDAFLTVTGGDSAPTLVLGVELRSLEERDQATKAFELAIAGAVSDIIGTTADGDPRVWTIHWQPTAEALLARWETLDGRDELAADAFEQGEPTSTVVTRVDELAASHPRDVADLVTRWLATDRRRLVVIEPTGPAPERYPAALDPLAVTVPVANETLAERPTVAPPVVPLAAAERFVTANGLHVVLWPHGETPLVQGVLRAGDQVFTSRELATEVDLTVARLAWNLRMHDHAPDAMPARSTLVIAGKFDDALVKRHLEYQTGHLASGTALPVAKVDLDAAAARLVFGQLSALDNKGFVFSRQQVLDELTLPGGPTATAVAEQLALLAEVGLDDVPLQRIVDRVATMTYEWYFALVTRTHPRPLVVTAGHAVIPPTAALLAPSASEIPYSGEDLSTVRPTDGPAEMELLPIPIPLPVH